MDLLAEQLNDYSRHGIPRLPHLLSFEADEDTEEALYRYIYGHYLCFVVGRRDRCHYRTFFIVTLRDRYRWVYIDRDKFACCIEVLMALDYYGTSSEVNMTSRIRFYCCWPFLPVCSPFLIYYYYIEILYIIQMIHSWSIHIYYIFLCTQFGGRLEVDRDWLDFVARATTSATERHLGTRPDWSGLSTHSQSHHWRKSRSV